jgi:hypothetical protein
MMKRKQTGGHRETTIHKIQCEQDLETKLPLPILSLPSLRSGGKECIRYKNEHSVLTSSKGFRSTANAAQMLHKESTITELEQHEQPASFLTVK